MQKPSYAGLALVALLTGCGGKVIFDTSAAGTGSGGAQTTGSGATTSGHTGTATTATNATTNVGTTTTTTKASTGFSASSVAVTTGVSTSSGFVPNCTNFGWEGIGGPCNQPGAECFASHSCCGEHAVCQNGTWQPSPNGPFCNHPCIPCGPDMPFACDPGNVCVDHNFGGNHTYVCAHDPCPPGQLGCGCAQSVCQQMGAGMTCAMTGQDTVTCVPQI